jgi:GrpB-like predicted nucleotidyltransferase (UPF0157 family)
MSEYISVISYDPEWPNLFKFLGQRLRPGLQHVANRIDHIGSTSISGMPAKPIIDIQVSVMTLEPMDQYRTILESLGFVWRADNPDLTKRYFRESPGNRRVHIHVRQSGTWGEQFALLFRDYMRAHPQDAEQYAKLKYLLAEQYQKDRKGYVAAKAPFIWGVMQRATEWSQTTGWYPSGSDA